MDTISPLPTSPQGAQWCRRFAHEGAWQNRRHTKTWTTSTFALLFLSIAGLVLTVPSIVAFPETLWRWLELVPWIVSTLLTLIERPRTTSQTLLAIFCATFIGGIFSMATVYTTLDHISILRIGGACVALSAILVILSMPMRDPTWDATGIAGRHDGATVQLRSPEDNLTLWQFLTVSWLAPLIRLGSRKQLNDEDVWLLPYEFQHTRLHMMFRELKGSIIKRLLLANGLDLIIITVLGVMESAATLASPVLLQRLLVAIEDMGENPERRADAVGFAVAILVLRLFACQSSVLSLWFSRRSYERSRGEMITTIYAKTLTRKYQSFQPTEKDTSHVNGNVLDGDEPEKGRFAWLMTRLRLRRGGSKKKIAPAKPPATMGKILNLMRNDCYEVAQRFWDFPSLITKPLQFVLSLVLVWLLLGWPCLLGVAWVVIVQLLNATFVRQLITRERLRRAATDARLQATSQFVEAIRHLRWYDWQSKWQEKIMKERDHELHLKIITGLWTIGIATINVSAGALFPIASFFAYTYIAGNRLPVNIIFPALQLFTMLEMSLQELPDLITMLLNASVAVGRLETFMNEPDKDEGFQDNAASDIVFRGASLAWPGTNNLVLHNLNLDFSTGLTVICGKVGSGKTALLQAILGELDMQTGECSIPDEMVGFCAQAPWLQHMNIRENILFCAPYDPVRYKQVLDACALTPDLANFKHGDLSNIGENGIGLSGGQKARVALARAIYSRSRVLLLDDPLAPLDHNTAESIVKKLLAGPLVDGRIVVLVTHRVDLVTHMADKVIEIDGGRARELDADDIPQKITNIPSKANGHAEKENTTDATEEQEGDAIPDKFIEDEKRVSGGVVASVYWVYIKAGKLRWWSFLVAVFALTRFGRIFNSWFLKAWGEAYGSPAPAGTQANTSPSSSLYVMMSELSGTVVALNLPAGSSGSFASGLFNRLPNPDDDVGPWLIWYLGIALVMTLLVAVAQGSMLLILYTASKNMFVRVIRKVSNANFRFYDVTPVGRLMNRLTSDIGMLDGGIIGPLKNMALYALIWLSSMVIIALTTPVFFIFALAMTCGFVYIFRQFLPTSQSLRRLEMVSLSPLMSNFGILLEGLATIRAFKAQPHFQDRNIVVTDAFQKMDHFYWSLQSWLMYRFDALSAFSTFILTIIALYREFSPGLTAFVLVTASQFVEATHSLCRVYGELQMDFVSVERVVELLDIEEEPSGDVEPPASWPAYGDDIRFDSVTMRYAPHLDPSLSDITFTIPGGATCAVLGRTGSGKSTLALALLATLQPEKGTISVGAMDISKVNVHTWRQRISFVAQDPVLFPGTLRQNLDPLEEHTDDECTAVLHRTLGPGWSLTSHVDGGGKNLSQGQRQLVGIGRAVLRRSPVVVLDEATASIDKKTALAIQDVLRDELKESTVITIAHRLEAVKDADYFVRLDAGRVVECGPAATG
ncbi:ABC transporter [Pseudomassariella vexata]|uniref:ABC transporter n=1 Tax=Pseudomassariella vexata TaxID=1141098 RepID=A0A1Y2DT69_9PEZI|nr:ABC transporter [Pseudomassariella vexata]ORY62344.1 ABC transporter [Pseudomassariella vexata]